MRVIRILEMGNIAVWDGLATSKEVCHSRMYSRSLAATTR